MKMEQELDGKLVADDGQMLTLRADWVISAFGSDLIDPEGGKVDHYFFSFLIFFLTS